ncbi:MAG TPA: hypothetical protein VE338_18910 [Ktedonobacterales bacterium]|jgi:hypothetical protein|nr:hypothetical protein [Ktedonobacterales bacterium]
MNNQRTVERVEDHFAQNSAQSDLSAHWAHPLAGAARLQLTESGLRLELGRTSSGHYSNAQIDDYSGRRASRYPWRPPLRLRVRARASHAAHPTRPRRDTRPAEEWLRGTVGFGFWNAPMTRAGGGLRLPDAIWFFGASPPSNMSLTADGLGYGWKAQVVHAHRPGALLAAPPLALTALWARVSGDDHPAASWLEKMTGAREAILDTAGADLRQWHDYSLEWLPDRARFWVDGRESLAVEHPPRGPLGFVAWIDNQYAIATPRGELRFGALDCGPQWLELASISIEPLT